MLVPTRRKKIRIYIELYEYSTNKINHYDFVRNKPHKIHIFYNYELLYILKCMTISSE
jgi:hypothetical protein